MSLLAQHSPVQVWLVEEAAEAAPLTVHLRHQVPGRLMQQVEAAAAAAAVVAEVLRRWRSHQPSVQLE